MDGRLRAGLEVGWGRGLQELGPGREEWGADSGLESRYGAVSTPHPVCPG